MLVTTTNNATPMYNTAKNTTLYSAIFAIRCTPPKIIAAKAMAMIIPTVRRSVPNEF